MTEPTRSRDRFHDATMGETEQYDQGAEDMRAVVIARLTAAGLTAAAEMVATIPPRVPSETVTGLHYRGG